MIKKAFALFVSFLLIAPSAFAEVTPIEAFEQYCRDDPTMQRVIGQTSFHEYENDDCPNLNLLKNCLNYTGGVIFWEWDDLSKVTEINDRTDENAARCEQSCASGNMNSCAMLGEYFAEINGPSDMWSHIRMPFQDWERTWIGTELLRKACEGGVARACESLIVTARQFWSPLQTEILSQCGDYSDCDVDQYVALHEQFSEQGMVYNAPAEFAEKGCALGSATACRLGYKMLMDYPNWAPHEKYDLEYFRAQTCAFGNKLDCNQVGGSPINPD